MAMAERFYDIIDKLSDDRKGIIYKLALDMLSAQEMEGFDDYTPEEAQAITQARERIAAGDCLTFSSSEEMAAHLGV